MTKIAYLANELPAAVEWYVAEEIDELRHRGFQVIPCSARTVPGHQVPAEMQDLARETIGLLPLSPGSILAGVALCAMCVRALSDLWQRVLFKGHEPWRQRMRTLVHTFLGACLAQRLQKTGIAHIHVHHGYYASWIALVAARLLGIPFSITLHGSDLLVRGAYLDTKLAQCEFCLTISQFNRRHILAHFPEIDPHKVLVQRLGVSVPVAPPASDVSAHAELSESRPLTLLSVGRLHAVKNQSFLIQACFFLKECGLPLRCRIAGEGPERNRLEFLIRELGLQDTVELLGQVPHREISRYYEQADLVVLTSRSEGIPLVLMEAMAHGRLVLAPAITGIPELVLDGRTGFLYSPGMLEEFVWRVDQIARSLPALHSVRRAAREYVREHFNLAANRYSLGTLFLQRVAHQSSEGVYEDPVLQQI